MYNRPDYWKTGPQKREQYGIGADTKRRMLQMTLKPQDWERNRLCLTYVRVQVWNLRRTRCDIRTTNLQSPVASDDTRHNIHDMICSNVQYTYPYVPMFQHFTCVYHRYMYMY